MGGAPSWCRTSPFTPRGRGPFPKRWRILAAGRLLPLAGLPMAEAKHRRPGPPEETRDEVSDRSLLRKLRQGSEDAARQLYLRYAERLYALARAQSSPDLARRVDAEEIVQSVFGSFFRVAGSGDYDVPEGEELSRCRWGRLLAVVGVETEECYLEP